MKKALLITGLLIIFALAACQDGASGQAAKAKSSRSLPGAISTKADLTIQDMTWKPETPRVGEDVTFSITIKNLGANAGTTTLGFRRSDVDYKGTTIPVGKIGGGKSKVLTFTTSYTVPGTHRATVITDFDTVIAENVETNNVFYKKVEVLPAK